MNKDISTKYQKLTHIEHILKRPGMYIGGIEEIDGNVYVLSNNKIIEKNIKYSPGLYKIFDEIIVNAYDQSIKDNTLTVIKVNINKEKNQISVYNDGIGIDVIMHPKEKIYVPELIFGHLMTSTSFDESKPRITGGIHGLGAKLTAIFSKYFKVDIGDSINQKKFSQIYKNHLSNKSSPIIDKYNEKKGYVKITFEPDLKYFKLTELSDDLISLMERRVYDIAALTRKNVKVYLNDTKIEINDFEEYVKLYTTNSFIRETCDKTSIKIDENRWNIIVAKSNNGFHQVSFVNGIYTLNGGYHVNYIVGKLMKNIKEIIEKKYKSQIKDNFIKDQFWVFISAVIENPTFSSQTKDELMTPISKFGSTCELSGGFIKKLFEKLNLDAVFQEHIRIMQSSDLSKLDVKKKSAVKGIKKLYDANHAGTKKSLECTLILTEGDSAKTMAISGLSAIQKASNIYGVFPLKGKLLNVREASHSQIINNEEFKNIKNILGLTVNKHYTKENISDLRYGSIMLMMDADVDGSHIKGLFINMIDFYWPSLLKIDGFIKIFITPIVKASSKNKVISFFSQNEYNKFKKQHENENWNIKYYKGLGTNTAEEARKYFADIQEYVLFMKWNDKTTQAIELAFSKKNTEERKTWLKKYDMSDVVDYKDKNLTYYNFVHQELKHFSNYDNIRSIPNIMDGLKPSQRKVLYSAFKRDLKSDIKVAQLIGYISEHTSYHHGETSLANTIVNMAQNYVGSNNLNLLMPKGQFGSRIQGGKDHASPRYIYTQLEKYTRLIFKKEDDELLKYLDDDGFMIEPEYYVPIVPMILINGAEGIGTGYSTYIPKYNPKDIIENLKIKLAGGKFKRMTPWYNKFKGKIIKVDSNIYHTKGTYNVNGLDLNITELPIGTWTENYKDMIDDMMTNGNIIKNFKTNSNETDIDFSIKLHEKLEEKYIEKLFGLITSINMTNMHMYSSSGIIKRYNDENKILEEFYLVRFDFYIKRKALLIKKLEELILLLESKIKFINDVMTNKLILYKKSKDEIIKILEKNKFLKIEASYDYLLIMSFYSLTKETMHDLNEQYKNKQNEYNKLKKKSPSDLWIDDLDELLKVLYQ